VVCRGGGHCDDVKREPVEVEFHVDGSAYTWCPKGLLEPDDQVILDDLDGRLVLVRDNDPTTRSIRSCPSGIVSPTRQFVTVLCIVGGSAGVPSSCSSRNWNAIRLLPPSNRLGPNGAAILSRGDLGAGVVETPWSLAAREPALLRRRLPENQNRTPDHCRHGCEKDGPQNEFLPPVIGSVRAREPHVEIGDKRDGDADCDENAAAANPFAATTHSNRDLRTDHITMTHRSTTQRRGSGDPNALPVRQAIGSLNVLPWQLFGLSAHPDDPGELGRTSIGRPQSGAQDESSRPVD
jgi:hypothetical protein